MYDTVIEPQVLLGQLGAADWCVLDCRASLADLRHGQQAYLSAHIPFAVFADLATDLSGPLIPGVSGRHPLPDPAVLAATFARWGIGNTTQVVAYDAANGAFAARAWWLLRWLGHAAVAVLNGGLAAWQSAGYDVRSGVEHRSPTRFETRAALTRTVGAQDIIDGGDTIVLLDARNEIRFRGELEPIDPVAGHIPGARCVPFEGNLDAANRFLSPAALKDRFDAAVAGELVLADLVCYCGSGVTACHNILALRHAGFAEPALYPGSFSEWIQDPARAVAR
jgi:thiosulfate/3-mercaptopyruvate sulfurtransferase